MAEENVVGAPVSDAKPFVQVACICEKVLIEQDNVASLIRIVDTSTIELPTNPPPGVGILMDLTVFVSLKSGDVVGESEVGLRLIAPDNVEHPVRMWPVEFRGNESGVNLRIALALQGPKLGLYWLDVLWKEEVLTRIPFRLKSKPGESTDVAAPTETVMH